MEGFAKALEKYLMRRFDVSGKSHTLGVEKVGNVADTEQWKIIIDSMETNIYLPTTENGLLRRNGSFFAPVTLACPPLSADRRKSVLSVSTSVKHIADFSSYLKNETNVVVTPLAQQLQEEEGKSLENLWDWIYLPINIAVVEMINLKAYTACLRMQQPGMRSIDMVSRSVHTLVNAFLRYYTDVDDPASWGSDEDLSSVSTVDKQGIVVLDPTITTIDFNTDSPIDFCTTSQSKPLVVARLKDGVHIDGVHVAGTPAFPYCSWRRGIVGVKNDDPRRVIVSRSCARALRINEPEEPWAMTDYRLDIDTVSLPGIRITHPMTYEDGIVVSKTMARKLGAFKEYVDRIVVPKSSLVTLTASPLEVDVSSQKELMRIVEAITRSEESNDSPYVMFPNKAVAIISITTRDGEEQHKEIRANVPRKSVFIKMETAEFVNDLGIEMLQVMFKYMTYLPLKVGDKVADLHGNKCTIVRIIDDSEMPTWSNGKAHCKVHYIAPPWVGKRLAVGAAIEDALAFRGYCSKEAIVVDSAEDLTLEWAYTITPFDEMCGTVRGKLTDEQKDVPLSLRAMARLDNNVDETLTVSRGIIFDENGDIATQNPKLWVEMAILAAKGATSIASFFINESRIAERFARLQPVFNAIKRTVPVDAKTFVISKRIPREYLSTASWEYAQEVFAETAADHRLSEGYYGVIQAGKYKVIVPPHTPVVQSAQGAWHIGKIAIEANRVVADALSASQGYATVSVEGAISRYMDFLASILWRKDGAVRSVLSPRAPYAIRSVVVNSCYHDPHTIFVPERALTRLMKDERFREAYEHVETIEALVKRDPVHYVRHMVGVKVKPWEHSAIGVHPALISELDGDYDGDTVTVMFPLTTEGVSKLRLKDAPNVSKPVEGVDIEYVTLALEHRKGKPSHFLRLHENDAIKNNDLYEKLRTGTCDDKERKIAILDFTKIKTGTALTGALGLAAIFSTDVRDKERLTAAMSLYHKLAQDTLDAKASGETPSLEVVEAVASEDSEKLEQAAGKLGLTMQESEVLRWWFYRVRDARRSKTKPTPPVYGATQRSAKFVDIKRMIEYVDHGVMKPTLLESMVHGSNEFCALMLDAAQQQAQAI